MTMKEKFKPGWLGTAGLVLMVASGAVLGAAAPAPMPAPEPPDFEARLEAAEAKLDAAAKQLRELYREKRSSENKPKKAMLGVLVEPDGRDKGVKLTGITPGGGAEAAGLKSRDVLVAINGVRLDDPDDDRGSMRALTDIMKDVAPGESVTVDYRRGKEENTAVLVTREHYKDLDAMMGELDIDIDLDGLGDDMARAAEEIAANALVIASNALRSANMATVPEAPEAPAAPLADLESFAKTVSLTTSSQRFIDLDADLARYFGVDGGVLAVDVPQSANGLRSGDVLLSIDGDAVSDADAVLEHLKAADAAVTAEIFRNGSAMTLELEPELYVGGKTVSVIRIIQDGDDVEVSVDSDD
ncbi:MAG: hypothetical protein AAF648_10875 [Pseudomonadota bacterium]